MSNSNGPIRRRRIAGESKPTVGPAEIKRRLVPKAPRKAATVDPVAPTKGPLYAGAQPAPRSAPTGPPAPLTNTAKSVRAKVPFPPRTQWRWFIPLALVAFFAVVFAAVFAVRGVSDFRQEHGIEASSTKASAAAGSAAETIFSFRYDKLDEHLAASKALMTPAFTKEFDKIAPALTELAPQRRIVVQAQSRNAAALECGNECSPTKFSILVFLDQARLVGDSKVPKVFGNRIVVDMVKLNGIWLVNDIRAL